MSGIGRSSLNYYDEDALLNLTSLNRNLKEVTHYEDYLLKLGLSDRPVHWRTIWQECLAGSHHREAGAPVSA